MDLKTLVCAIVVVGFDLHVKAQEPVAYHSPVDIPLLLSGNFGEPRPNHFHCGIDIKTQGVEGKRVLAVADGYVSRLTVGLDGFGNAVYVTQGDGYVSVYCHLKAFHPALYKRVLQKQYEEESETVDVCLSSDDFPVAAGDFIAYSGNTGASLAPHLHLELHRESDGALVDPLPHFMNLLTDNLKPVVHGVGLYPYRGKGVVEGKDEAITFTVTDDASRRVVKAWGRVGAAIRAEDVMDGTQNKYGLHHITLFVDGRQVFQSIMNEFLPTDNPMVNSWGDYKLYKKTRHWYLKSFVEPGNSLALLVTDANRGWVDIVEERDYLFEYQLEDVKGNERIVRFTVRGVEEADEMAASEAKEVQNRAKGIWLEYDKPQVVQLPGMELRILVGALADNVALHPHVKDNPDGTSHIYVLHDDYLPLLKRATLMMAPRVCTLPFDKYYIASSHGYVATDYADGWFSARIRELGDEYQLRIDTVVPHFCWLSDKESEGTVIRYEAADNESGLEWMKAYIDGEFVLFKADGNTFSCRLADTPVEAKNIVRKLIVKVSDRCGNICEAEREIVY